MEHVKRSFKVSLSITHPSIDPETISRETISRTLSLAASRQSKVGQQRITPAGALVAGTYQFSSWGHKFDTSNVTDLTEFLPTIIERLRPHGSYFSDLVDQGGSVELFCGIFVNGNWDESFHHTLLRSFADMAIDLRLDVYAKSDEPKA